jgi:hypothetical protein
MIFILDIQKVRNANQTSTMKNTIQKNLVRTRIFLM